MNQSSITNINQHIIHELAENFNDETCENLARETGFIQRSTSRLSGRDFFDLFTAETMGEATISYEGLCDILEERHSDLKITPQALCDRVNSDGAVSFLKAALENTLKENSCASVATIESTWLDPFLRVLLEDSTQIEVNEKLAQEFKGSGGNASAASVKIDYSYDIKNEKAEHIAIRQGADCDQGFANNMADWVKKDDLVIRDLGYLSLDFFAFLTTIGAYFLSRLGFNVGVYLTAETEEPVNLISHINRFGAGKNTMEFNVFIGRKHRIPVRLIAYRLPADVYRIRQKAAIKAAKRKGRRVSLSYLKFLKFSFFVTNVPWNLWSKEAVGTVYRLRWQVELTFKQWKSLFQINVLKGTRPERIYCLIYGRLIVILVMQRLLAISANQAINEKRELSFYKAIQWLMRGERFSKAFINRQFSELLTLMLSKFKRLFKQKRKRLTSRQLITQQIGYMDSFSDIKHYNEDLIASEGA